MKYDRDGNQSSRVAYVKNNIYFLDSYFSSTFPPIDSSGMNTTTPTTNTTTTTTTNASTFHTMPVVDDVNKFEAARRGGRRNAFGDLEQQFHQSTQSIFSLNLFEILCFFFSQCCDYFRCNGSNDARLSIDVIKTIIHTRYSMQAMTNSRSIFSVYKFKKKNVPSRIALCFFCSQCIKTTNE